MTTSLHNNNRSTTSSPITNIPNSYTNGNGNKKPMTQIIKNNKYSDQQQSINTDIKKVNGNVNSNVKGTINGSVSINDNIRSNHPNTYTYTNTNTDRDRDSNSNANGIGHIIKTNNSNNNPNPNKSIIKPAQKQP